MNAINAQFAHPSGWLGSLAGWIMSIENQARIRWAVGELRVQPGDAVLEIGFGPGVAIELLAHRVTVGSIAGVDASAEMVAMASRRNARAIRAGKVALKGGRAEALPYVDASFDKVFAINSMRFWADPAGSVTPGRAGGLDQVARVLKPGGQVAIFEQPITAATPEGMEGLIWALSEQLRAAGFHDVRSTLKPMKPAPVVGVIGVK